MITSLVENCDHCANGEIYPDGRTRCGIEKCNYEQGIPKLWHKPKVGKG